MKTIVIILLLFLFIHKSEAQKPFVIFSKWKSVSAGMKGGTDSNYYNFTLVSKKNTEIDTINIRNERIILTKQLLFKDTFENFCCNIHKE